MLINEIRKIPKDNIICNAKCVILRKIYKHQDQVTPFYNIIFESKDVSWLSNYEKKTFFLTLSVIKNQTPCLLTVFNMLQRRHLESD